jgi:hypothetical protein
MNEPSNPSEEIDTHHGLIGFFDVLGYKNIIENNQIKECALAIKRILETIRIRQERIDMIGLLTAQKLCSHVLFSDSILVYSPLIGTDNKQIPVLMFTSYCANLVTELLVQGFPVRGALALGDYYVENHIGSICLAGKPIAEAHELSECLDLAGCVVAPSAETFFSDTHYFFAHPVPLKNRPAQKMMMLNQCADSSGGPELSRQFIMGRFGDHNKHIGIDVLPKINNTLEFLEACKRHSAGSPETNELT